MKRMPYLAMLMLMAIPGSGQSLPAEPQNTLPDITSTSTLVIVPTLVRSPAGQLVTNLVATDFRLTDNGVEQKASLEEIQHQPLSVVVLLQTGGAGPRQFQNYRDLGTMLDYMMGSSKHQVAVVTFDSQPEEMWSFTDNVDDLKDAFTNPGNGDGGAAILDAVNYGIDLLKHRPASSRRILLLFSQPQDDGSRARAKDVVERLGASNTTIYSITFSPEKTWLKEQFTKPRHESPLYQLSPNLPPLLHTFDWGTPLSVALKAVRQDTAAEVAELSGGEHLRFDDKRDLERQLAILANHIPNRYILSFRPSANVPGFHAINVQVLHHPQTTLDVAARSSYWVTGTTPNP